ncbi:hypothetical protein V494_01730 [Pseudogymnoascus sp. VKM F-4513 (FW-928)]|nr:hypothetical protein V494_01730 [Pseudogymnoascus sp. VKM F-4513 (FW-928)]
MDPITPPVRKRASISSTSLTKSEEEIVKKLNSHPERLSSGELAKTLLSTFNKNLGRFSFATTFDAYLRWLEAQRRAPQTTINYNWKNVIMQWAQSLKARDIPLKRLVVGVENWKRSHGPFDDPRTEVNPRYPPTIDELEAAYNMDLRPHSARTPPSAHPTKKGDRYLPEEPKRGYRGPDPNKEATKSPVKHYSSSPNNSSVYTSTPSGTIGLLVLNVANYSNNEVVEIFHPDCRGTVTRLEAWLTNRTVHFQTVEDRDRAYYLLPDDIKARKEKDLSRPLVRIYSDRGNKSRSDIETSSVYAPSPEKISRRTYDINDTSDEIGLYFMNTGRYSRKDVERLFDERDVSNIVAVERLGKSDVVVRFPSLYLRDKALDHLPSYLKDETKTSRKTSLFVVLFNPDVHGRHPASRLRERQINGPDKYYGKRVENNDNRFEKPTSTEHGHISRWRRAHDENDDLRLPDRTLSDEGRLSRYDSTNNSSPEFGRNKVNAQTLPQNVGHEEREQPQYLNGEERMIWEQDGSEFFAKLWLETLADEIMERRNKPDEPTDNQNAPLLQHAALNIDDAGKTKVGLKRSRTPDHIDHSEYVDNCSKRTKRENNFVGPTDSFEEDLSDDVGLDCSTLDLTRVRRLNALQMWDRLDSAKPQEEAVKRDMSTPSYNDSVVGEIDDDVDGVNEGEEVDVQLSNIGLEPVSSPEDGWCSSRDYWAGSSGNSNSSELGEGKLQDPRDFEPASHKSLGESGDVDPPGANIVEMSDSDINLDADMVYGSPHTQSE